MKIFRKVSGERVDVVKHTLEILKDNPNVEIHIGTDSQNKKHETRYATVIAYHYNSRGVHYIVHTQRVNRINDIFTRLWKETELSLEVAEWLSQHISNIKIQIDMDYNSDEDHKSNKLISACQGWATSLGYKVNVKPFSQIATHAADHHCQ
jgi:uncharacterized protein